MNSLVLSKYRIQCDDSVCSSVSQSSAYRAKSYLPFDEELKTVPRRGRSKRHCEMKLSVCRVVIIVNRKVDNTAWAIFHTGGTSSVAGIYELPPCPLLPTIIIESEGRFASHAMPFLSRSTWRLRSVPHADVACAHTCKRFFDNVKLLLLAIVHDWLCDRSYCFSSCTRCRHCVQALDHMIDY